MLVEELGQKRSKTKGKKLKKSGSDGKKKGKGSKSSGSSKTKRGRKKGKSEKSRSKSGSKKGKKRKVHAEPIQMLYHRTQEITEPHFDYVQLEEKVITPVAVESNEIVTLPDRNKYRLETAVNFLHPLIQHLHDSENDADIVECSSGGKHEVDGILDIAPREGMILPNEVLRVAVKFSPKQSMKVFANAVCSIEGGCNEVLQISAVCAELSYCLNTTFVDFGRQVF